MEWQNSKQNGTRIRLTLTKEMLLAATKRSGEMIIEHAGQRIPVYYKLRSERVAGVDEVEFSCKCKGKYPEGFFSASY